MKKIKQLLPFIMSSFAFMLGIVFSPPASSKAYAAMLCGAGSEKVTTSIDIGCRGVGNPIIDMMFAFTRFLSVGVGIVVVGSIIVAGIQYTTSRGDPQATQKAITRVSKAGAALALYLLGFALLQYLVPGGLF